MLLLWMLQQIYEMWNVNHINFEATLNIAIIVISYNTHMYQVTYQNGKFISKI